MQRIIQLNYMAELLIIILSIFLLVYGFIKGNDSWLLTGAALYISIELISLIRAYISARSYKEGKWIKDANNTKIDRVNYWLKSLIVLLGLYLILDYKISPVSGIVIWIGTILCYAIAGLIATNVAGIPLKMGYGGWYVNRMKRGRKKK